MSTYTVINPATEEPVTEVELADRGRTDQLIDGPQAAFPGLARCRARGARPAAAPVRRAGR